MRPFRIYAMLFCITSLLSSAEAASNAVEPSRAVAVWLSQQLHRPVEASQVLLSPAANALEGCTIARVRPVSIGATSLSLHCPAHVLPQLVLLKFPATVATPLAVSAPPIVRAGAALRADWRTQFMHAELPVVALDSGAAGAEIRVRVANTSRIMHARILNAHTVTIIVTGA